MSARSIIMGTVGAVGGFFIGGPYGAVALGTAGFQAGQDMDAADKAVDAAKQNQALTNQAANETLQRASENTKAIMREGQTFKGEQIGTMVRGGVDISSQSSLVALENAHANFKRQAYLEQRDASLAAQRMRAQAQINTDMYKQARTAAQIGAVTSVIGTAAQVGMLSTRSPNGSNLRQSDYGSAGGSYTNTSTIT